MRRGEGMIEGWVGEGQAETDCQVRALFSTGKGVLPYTAGARS